MDPGVYAAAAATVIAAGGGVAYGRRNKSGRIRDTDAERLWTESHDFREALLAERAELRKDATDLKAEVAPLRERIAKLNEIIFAHKEALAENDRLRVEVEYWKTKANPEGRDQ